MAGYATGIGPVEDVVDRHVHRAFGIICKKDCFPPMDGIKEIIHIHNEQQRPQDATLDATGNQYECALLTDTN